MAIRMTRAFAHMHDAFLQGRRDESGLTMLAYALGAAAVVVPIAVLIFAFGSETATQAQAEVNNVVASSP